MPFEFDCSSCQSRLRVPDEVRGHHAECPHCGTIQLACEVDPAAPLSSDPPFAQRGASPHANAGTNPYRDDVPIPINPYAAPQSNAQLLWNAAQRFNLANRGDRFLGTVIDWCFFVLCTVPAIVCSAIAENMNSSQLSNVAGVLFVTCVAAYHGIQWYLIARTAQSVGKRALHMRIITLSGGPPGFLNGVVLRNWILGCSCFCYPIGMILLLVDGLMIFGVNKQCLHDMIASTLVIKE